MSLIPGQYQHYKNENLEDYLSAVGIPYMGRKIILMSSPLLDITLDGDTMSVRNHTLLFNLESTFKIGEEYDEKMPRQTLKTMTHEKINTLGKRYFRRLK